MMGTICASTLPPQGEPPATSSDAPRSGHESPGGPQRHLVIPIAAGSLLFALVYTPLHYLVVLRSPWIDPPELVIDLNGPISLSGVEGSPGARPSRTA
jgi:hypothetical protein